MRRFALDLPDDDAYDVRPNATCTDCGADFSRADEDPGTTCDPCSDRRDAWVTALERRMATVRPTDAQRTDVA